MAENTYPQAPELERLLSDIEAARRRVPLVVATANLAIAHSDLVNDRIRQEPTVSQEELDESLRILSSAFGFRLPTFPPPRV